MVCHICHHISISPLGRVQHGVMVSGSTHGTVASKGGHCKTAQGRVSVACQWGTQPHGGLSGQWPLVTLVVKEGHETGRTSMRDATGERAHLWMQVITC